MYSCLLSTAYYGLFRVSELTSGVHPVLACDVQIAKNKKKLLFILRTSKNHAKNAKPQMVKISSLDKKKRETILEKKHHESFSNSSLSFCPYNLLKNYLCCRGPYKSLTEPFFILQDGSPVTPAMMRSCLKKVLKECGFDERLYGTHSLRSGRTDDLLKLGLLVKTIKKLGRWKSNTIFKYLQYTYNIRFNFR